MQGFQPNTEGVFYDLPASDYHAAPGFSNSMGKHIEPTPAHLVAYLTEKREATPEMILGTLVHHAILEPTKPLPKIIVPPETYPAPADCTAVKTKKASVGDPLDWSWSAKYCKRWYDDALKEGYIVLTESEFATFKGCVDSVARHPVCQQIFNKGRSEVSLFKNFNLGGTCLRKARLDWVPVGNYLADIKTCQDASEPVFKKVIFDNDYHTQGASNLDIWNDSHPDPKDKKSHFLIIAVEKKKPYLTCVYRLSQRAIGKGRETHVKRMQTYIECCSNGVWPGYAEEIHEIELPEWAHGNKQAI